MLEITSASAQSTTAPNGAPSLPSAAKTHQGVKCHGARADGVQPNWWNAASTASSTATQPQSSGIMGALQSLIGALGGAAPSGSMRVSEVTQRNP